VTNQDPGEPIDSPRADSPIWQPEDLPTDGLCRMEPD